MDWFDSKTSALEKAWVAYMEMRDDYKKQVGFCPIQPFPAGFNEGWDAAKKAYGIDELKEEE